MGFVFLDEADIQLLQSYVFCNARKACGSKRCQALQEIIARAKAKAA